MKDLKAAQHHWWPRCVSRHWVDADGKVGRIEPSGRVIRVPPHKLGSIGNGHHGKLSNKAGFDTTDWDFTFEQEFTNADGRFSEVISWLVSLKHAPIVGSDLRDRFRAQPATDDLLRALTECVISLVIRSPMNRDAFASLAERFGLPASNADRDAVISMNMLGKQRTMSANIGATGKFAVLFSNKREFIYGDGCFNNLDGAVDPPHYPKLLVPVTPEIAVIVCRPLSYLVEPRLSSIVLADEETDYCNHAIQVYSRREMFFRSQPPSLDSAFTSGERRRYARADNPVDELMQAIPGIPPRDTSLDSLTWNEEQASPN